MYCTFSRSRPRANLRARTCNWLTREAMCKESLKSKSSKKVRPSSFHPTPKHIHCLRLRPYNAISSAFTNDCNGDLKSSSSLHHEQQRSWSRLYAQDQTRLCGHYSKEAHSNLVAKAFTIICTCSALFQEQIKFLLTHPSRPGHDKLNH